MGWSARAGSTRLREVADERDCRGHGETEGLGMEGMGGDASEMYDGEYDCGDGVRTGMGIVEAEMRRDG